MCFPSFFQHPVGGGGGGGGARRAARFCWGPSSSSSSFSSSPSVSLSTDVDPFSLPPLSVADHRKEKEIGGGGRIPSRYDAANVVWYWIEGLLDVI